MTTEKASHTHVCPNCILAETTGEDRVYTCSEPDCAEVHEQACIHCAADGERDLSTSVEDYEQWV